MGTGSVESQNRHYWDLSLIAIALFVALLGGLFLYYVGQYSLIGRHPFQFFADSNTYYDIYTGFMGDPDGLVNISHNFLGPIIILSALGGDIYLVMLLNFAIFVSSAIGVSRILNLNPLRVAAAQFISPLTAFSLLSVNKEIITIPVLVLLIWSYRKRIIYPLVLAVILSLMARWQLTIFCVVLIAVYFFRNSNRYMVMGYLLLFISAAYFMLEEFLEPVLLSVEASTSTYTEGSGLFERLNELQNAGFYFLVAPIKAAHLLFSLGLRVGAIINPIEIYNDQIIGSFCLINIFLFILLILTKKFTPRNDLVMISFIYIIVFALTPVYAPRYFYPVTVLWALALAGTRDSIPDEPPATAVAPQRS